MDINGRRLAKRRTGGRDCSAIRVRIEVVVLVAIEVTPDVLAFRNSDGIRAHSLKMSRFGRLAGPHRVVGSLEWSTGRRRVQALESSCPSHIDVHLLNVRKSGF